MKLNEVVDPKTKVENTLKRYKIEDYIIHDDLSVSVKKGVRFYKNTFTKLPIKFHVVEGDFEIIECKLLTSLNGCPNHVTGTFQFRGNNNIIRTLEGGPTVVGHDYAVRSCLIYNLEGSPKHIHGNYIISHCYSLNSLKGCPEIVDRSFTIYSCSKLYSIDYLPKSINGELNFYWTSNVSNLLKIFQVKGVKSFLYQHKNDDLVRIINKHLPTRDIIGCQDELIDAGLEEFARTK